MSPAARYPIGVTARLTGLPVETLRAWERRYGIVAPRREGTVRTYGEQDVAKLRTLARLVAAGHPIGRLARLGRRELEVLVAAEGGAARGGERDRHPGAEAVWAALERMDVSALHAALEQVAAVLPPDALCLEVALPLLRDVGAAWAAGRMSIAHEHVLSSALRNLLGSLVRLRRPSPDDPPVLLAAPEGELHELGLLSAAHLASAAGVAPVYLGPNTPAADVVAAAQATRARAVVLAVVTRRASPDPIASVREIARALGPGVELIVGGAASEELAAALRPGPARFLPDLDGLARELRRIAAT